MTWHYSRMNTLLWSLWLCTYWVTFVTTYDQEDEALLEELGYYLEDGDVLYPLEAPRLAKKDLAIKWPNGEVPFQISSGFTELEKKLITDALGVIQASTCVKFFDISLNETNDKFKKQEVKRVLFMKTGNICSSNIGVQEHSMVTMVTLPSQCLSPQGLILHEVMHALGFLHEHSRPDREKYIDIVWKNVKEDHKDDFKKYSEEEVLTFNLPYDYDSVMHYKETEFSSNNQPTIVVKGSTKAHIGQRDKLSEQDKKNINMLYGCKI